MEIRVHFYSWFKDVTGCADTVVALEPQSSIRDLKTRVFDKFPKLASLEKSTLVAVGVDYQTADYILREGDEVSFFPPVQGG
jgi:molybdopterin converting factor small subunit